MQGSTRQSLGVLQMAIALVVAAFLGGGLGMLFEGGGDTSKPAANAQSAN